MRTCALGHISHPRKCAKEQNTQNKRRCCEGFTKGVTGGHIRWADRHCWNSQRKVNREML